MTMRPVSPRCIPLPQAPWLAGVRRVLTLALSTPAAAFAAATGAPWEAPLQAFLNSLTGLYPLWLVIFVAIALIHPPAFAWFSGQWVVWAMSVVMLGMRKMRRKSSMLSAVERRTLDWLWLSLTDST